MGTPRQRFSDGPHRKRKRTCRVCGCTDNNSSECVKLSGCPCHWVEKDLCSVCADIGKLKEKPKNYKKAIRWNKLHPVEYAAYLKKLRSGA